MGHCGASLEADQEDNKNLPMDVQSGGRRGRKRTRRRRGGMGCGSHHGSKKKKHSKKRRGGMGCGSHTKKRKHRKRK